MHISLDSALGRQRRLNSVGESVLQIAPNAAAAYSLRSLTGGDPKVVRVRRSSDNGESDFTASGVSSSALTSFVNEDVELFSNDFEANTSGFTLNTGGSNVAVRNTSDGFSGSGCLQLNLTSSSNSINTIKTDTYMQDTDGVTYTVSFYAKAISGSANLVLKIGTESSSVQQISFSENGGEWVKHSLTFVNNFGAGAGNRNQRILFAGSTSATTEWRIDDFKIVQTTSNGFVETWYDQSGNNRPLIQANATEQPLIVESGTFLNGVKSNKATSNDTMQNLQVSTDGTNADFGTDDWASGASLKLGAVYVGTVPADSVGTTSSPAIIWGGGRGIASFQEGGVSLSVIKGGTDSWSIRNERQGLSPSTMANATSLNTDADVVLYGTTDNREFTINVNGSGDTETESADLDVRENTPLSLFGSYAGNGSRYYQRSAGGVCKECYLYAGDPVANIPALATSINEHYSIY